MIPPDLCGLSLPDGSWFDADSINRIIKHHLGGGNKNAALTAFDQIMLIREAKEAQKAAAAENLDAFIERNIQTAALTVALTPALGAMAGIVASAIVNRINPPLPPPETDGQGARLPRKPAPTSGSIGATVAIQKTDTLMRRVINGNGGGYVDGRHSSGFA